MCLAIAKPARAFIPVEHLEAGYEGNPHGCGFCYPEGGKVVVVKGLMKFPEFLAKYREKEHLPMLIHFRMSTHGKPNFLNCHPFSFFNEQFALIHNGVIPIFLSYPELSDTGNFAKLVMEPMVKTGVDIDKSAFRFLVQQAIGSQNKICVMDASGRIVIYNEPSGEIEDAVDKDGNPVIEIDWEGKEYQEEVWYSHGGYKFNKRRLTRLYKDEYEGLFKCGQGDEAVIVEDMTTSVGEGFKGTPTTAVNSDFTNRAKLTPPTQSVIEGFKPGTLTKDAEKSAQVIDEAYRAVAHTDGKSLVKIKLPPKQANSSHIITEITSGPIYDAKTELEMAHLQDKMSLTREECIKYLGLKIEDCISYV